MQLDWFLIRYDSSLWFYSISVSTSPTYQCIGDMSIDEEGLISVDHPFDFEVCTTINFTLSCDMDEMSVGHQGVLLTIIDTDDSGPLIYNSSVRPDLHVKEHKRSQFLYGDTLLVCIFHSHLKFLYNHISTIELSGWLKDLKYYFKIFSWL